MDSFSPFEAKYKNPDGYGPTYEEWQKQLEAEALEREAARESALAKLAKLGLTAEEAQALFS
jgi:hypothetical protein